MSFLAKTTDNILACLWKPDIMAILTIWKLGQERTVHSFEVKEVPLCRVKGHFEQVVIETMVSMAAPPPFIHVQTMVEVEVLACDSQEAIVLHRERMEEVDFMIDAIEAVEHEYWGDMFA